jgi:hypothetical protein
MRIWVLIDGKHKKLNAYKNQDNFVFISWEGEMRQVKKEKDRFWVKNYWVIV